MRMSRKVTFEMEEEQLDRIIVDRLCEDYRGINMDVAGMRDKARQRGLPDHLREDLTKGEAMITALETMLRYYMIPSEAERFIGIVRDSVEEPEGEKLSDSIYHDAYGRRYLVTPRNVRVYIDAEDF